MSTRPEQVAPELPGFSLVEPLGRGGFADVYKYTQLGLGRQVAVKVLLAGVDGNDITAFQAEAQVMAQLSNHPSIVSIYQADVTADGRPFLVMEFCPPPHLGLRIRQRVLPVAKALETTIQVAGAVETAHRLGILHRDIKPANILFTEFGRPALTDFGISVTTASGAAGHGVGMSVPWAPPEQLTAGVPMGAPGDVYSLAATLWTSLVGRSPFHVTGGANDALEMSRRVRSAPVPPTRDPAVPESLERVLRTAMAKRAEERFASMVELARALQAVQAELHQSVTPIDVRDDQVVGLGETDEAGGGTRVTGFISIDPQPRAPRSTPAEPVRLAAAPPATPAPGAPPVHGPSGHLGTTSGTAPSATDTDDTVLGGDGSTGPGAPGGLAWGDGAPGSAVRASGDGARLRGRNLALAAAGVAVVVGVVVVATRGGDPGTAPPSAAPSLAAQPQDPVADDGVAAPTGVTVARAGDGSLQVTWTNPAPEVGDSYGVKLVDPVEERDWSYVEASPTTVQAAPGRECVLVRVVRQDGQASDSAQACPGEGAP